MKFQIFFLILLGLALTAEAIDYPWMYYLPYGENVTLKPLYRNKTEQVIVRSCKWTTPKQIDLFPDVHNYDLNRYRIDKYTCQLTIYNNQMDTNGIYHATVNDIYISKAMLNVHGAPKGSYLEEYGPNLIAGFSTAGCIVALFAITCGVYKYRYREPEVVTIRANSSQEYQNKSYAEENEEEEEDNRSIKL